MPIHQLTDGREVLIRPIRPEDKARIQGSWSEISDRTRYFRFLRAVKELSPQELKYFTEIDHRHHVAVMAVEAGVEENRSLGVARWIRLRDKPQTAEFAITVIDSYQGVGLGKLLLGHLVRTGREQGLTHLRAWIHAENKPMKNLYRKAGGVLIANEDSLLCYDLKLPTAARDLKPTSVGQILAAVCFGI